MANLNYTAYYLASTQSYWWEYTGGNTGTAFEVGNDAVFGVSKGAMRFSNVTISQGTTVNDAQIYMWVGLKSGTNLKAKVFGINEDNTAAFSSSPMGRPETTQNNTLDDTIPGTGQWRTINVSNPVNAILGRSGWISGNAMGFIIHDNGSGADSWIYDTQTNHASFLIIRLAALPNFTPSPTGVLAPSLPSDPAYGIKIANRDVKKATNKQLYYFSGKKELKILQRGTFDSTITQTHHLLPYLPCALGWWEDSNGQHMSSGSTSIVAAGTGVLYISIEWVSITPATGKTAYYYMLVDPLLT